MFAQRQYAFHKLQQQSPVTCRRWRALADHQVSRQVWPHQNARDSAVAVLDGDGSEPGAAFAASTSVLLLDAVKRLADGCGGRAAVGDRSSHSDPCA